jgi:hypothetical protein
VALEPRAFAGAGKADGENHHAFWRTLGRGDSNSKGRRRHSTTGRRGWRYWPLTRTSSSATSATTTAAGAASIATGLRHDCGFSSCCA